MPIHKVCMIWISHELSLILLVVQSHLVEDCTVSKFRQHKLCFLITYSNIRTNLSLDISFLLWAVIWSEGTGVMDGKCINVQNLWNCPTFCEMFPRTVSVMWCYEFKFDLSLLQRSLESTGSKLQFGAIISQDLGGFLFISVFVIDDEGTDCFWP